MTEPSTDRRRFDRIATDKPVDVEAGPHAMTGTVLDVSLRGLLFTVDGDWRPEQGERVRAHIKLDDETCCIDMDGEVAHVEGAHIGLHSLSLDLESASRLRRMVELNLADDKLLERNLAELISNH